MYDDLIAQDLNTLLELRQNMARVEEYVTLIKNSDPSPEDLLYAIDVLVHLLSETTEGYIMQGERLNKVMSDILSIQEKK